MVPSEYASFFIAAASAGGALIGLLFVAVSFAPQRFIQPSVPVVSRVTAGSTFTALFNGFLISLGALLPHLNFGVITVIAGAIGIVNSVSQAWLMLKPWPSWQNVARRLWLTAISLCLYIYTFICAIQLLLAPSHTDLVFTLGILLMGIFGMALLRAWELLGVQRTGLLAWLNPLYELSTKTSNPLVNTDQSDA
jgi:hypothetical protein